MTAPMPAMPLTSLPPEQLRRGCDPASLGFASTADLDPLPGGLGQERAEEALHFGLTMAHPGYHVFVMGEPGSSRHTTVFRLVKALAAQGRTPPDLCYLHNFDDPRQPRLLRLPAGRGARLKADLQQLVRELPPGHRSGLERRYARRPGRGPAGQPQAPGREGHRRPRQGSGSRRPRPAEHPGRLCLRSHARRQTHEPRGFRGLMISCMSHAPTIFMPKRPGLTPSQRIAVTWA